MVTIFNVSPGPLAIGMGPVVKSCECIDVDDAVAAELTNGPDFSTDLGMVRIRAWINAGKPSYSAPSDGLFVVYCPQATRHAATEYSIAREAVYSQIETRFIDVSSDGEAYWRCLADLWAQGRDFVRWEHDVIAPEGGLDVLRDCPEPFCSLGSGGWLIRCRADLLALFPDLLDSIEPQLRRWEFVDQAMFARLLELGVPMHVHEPVAEHRNKTNGAERVAHYAELARPKYRGQCST